MDAHGAESSRGEALLRETRETARPRHRLLVCDPTGALDREAWRALEDLRCDVVVCRDSGAVLEDVVQHRPAVIVFGLRADAASDVAILHLVRRISPDVALVPIASEDSLAIRIKMLALRPIYFAVTPIDPNELFQAITAALAAQRPRPERSGWLAPGSLRLS